MNQSNEVFEEILAEAAYDLYSEQIANTYTKLAYYNTMYRQARSIQEATLVQGHIAQCKKGLTDIDSAIEKSVIEFVERMELDEGVVGFAVNLAKKVAKKAADKMSNPQPKAGNAIAETYMGTGPVPGAGPNPMVKAAANVLSNLPSAAFGVVSPAAAVAATAARAMGKKLSQDNKTTAGGMPAGSKPVRGSKNKFYVQ